MHKLERPIAPSYPIEEPIADFSHCYFRQWHCGVLCARPAHKGKYNDLVPEDSHFRTRYLGICRLGATHQVDDLHYSGDRYLRRFSLFNLPRTSWAAGRVRAAVSKPRRPSESHNTGGGQSLKRFTCRFPRQETSASARTVQEG